MTDGDAISGLTVDDIRVDVSSRPLHDRERRLLAADLDERGIAPSMLDVIPPHGRSFQILRALGPGGDLLGVTTLMSVRPFVSIKQILGEGNHVGWDTTTYYAQGVPRREVAAALLRSMAARSLYCAMYFGRLDDDIRAALPLVRHRLLETDYRLGEIDCTGYTTVEDYLGGHKRLRRHLRHHARAGGTVHVHEGPVPVSLADAFARLVHSTYKHHGGMGRWQFRDYAHRTCHSFFANCADAVHIYTRREGAVTGLQAYVRHRDRLELSEGGFDRASPGHHAYEAIIAESVAYAIDNGLGHVGYGGIWNAGKDRYTDDEDRAPIYLLLLYAHRWQYRLVGDRLSAWGFRTYFGGRFSGASGRTEIVSRSEHA